MNRGWDIFKNINDFVRFSDTKAGSILAFAGGSAAFLSTKADIIHGIINEHGQSAWGIFLFLTVICYLVSLVATIACAITSIRPTLSAGESRSLIYFKHICEDYKRDHERYANALAALDDLAMERELAQQICANALVADRKFRWVERAIVGLSWALASWALIVLLILLLGTASDR